MFGQIQRDNALIAAENEAGSMLTKLTYDQLAAGISLGANVKNYQTNLEIAKKVGVKTG